MKSKSNNSILRFIAFMVLVAIIANAATVVREDSIDKQLDVDTKQSAEDNPMMDPSPLQSMVTGEIPVQFGVMPTHDAQDDQDINYEGDEDYDEYEEDQEDYEEDDEEDDDDDEGYYDEDYDEEYDEDLDGDYEGDEDEVGYDEDTNEYVDSSPALDYEDLEILDDYPSSADPLLVLMKKRDITEKSSTGTKDAKAKSDDLASINTTAVEESLKLSALALTAPEPGGSCIDSFVNFALRFRERCTIQCLRTFVHTVSSPDVLGLLSCFGCSNFFIQGLMALGYDCAGLLSTPTMGKQSVNGDSRLGKIQSNVHPDDANLYPLNIGDMMKSLHGVTTGSLQEWFDMGDDLYRAYDASSQVKEGLSENSKLTNEQKTNLKTEEAKVDKELFNKFIGKAASFANWTLTPEILESSGVYDRLKGLNLI